MKTYFDLLPDDILEKIKMMIAINPPPHLNLFDVLYFQYINTLNTKQLIQMCKDTGVKQSQRGVVNQYVKRLNIIEKYLGRKLKLNDELVIAFTRGQEINSYRGWVI